MLDINGADLKLLKSRLKGSNFKKLLISKGLKKYSIAKECGITYRTLLNWEKGIVEPSDDNAIIVGRLLGLIKPDEAEILKIKKEIDKLNEKLNRLGS